LKTQAFTLRKKWKKKAGWAWGGRLPVETEGTILIGKTDSTSAIGRGARGEKVTQRRIAWCAKTEKHGSRGETKKKVFENRGTDGQKAQKGGKFGAE